MKKWMFVVTLVIGILIGSLIGKPVQSNARNIEIEWDGSYCFAIYKDSITFIKSGNSIIDCINNK